MNDKNRASALVSLIKNIDLAMLDEAQWDALTAIDVSRRADLIEVLRNFVKPEYASWDEASRRLADDALDAGLADPAYDFAPVLGCVQMPFAPVPDPRTFFLLIRQVLRETAR